VVENKESREEPEGSQKELLKSPDAPGLPHGSSLGSLKLRARIYS
jgi:hypothetical protein